MTTLKTTDTTHSNGVPFEIAIPQRDLDDLRDRLARTRWPDRETVTDLSQGVPLERMHALVDYWRSSYDWRRLEIRFNQYPHFKTMIDGLGIHYLHIRSPHPDALPLVMTHGWPGSMLEFLDVIEPLTNPTAFGGKESDAFHLVLPSLPGFGFSDQPTEKGWDRTRIAHAWDTLMKHLGYREYVAQGGDWGSVVTTEMGRLRLEGLKAIHVNLPFVLPHSIGAEQTEEESLALAQAELFASDGIAYHDLQTTRPQTLGYALADSPVGQAAWVYEKLYAWSDTDNRPEDVIGYDKIIDNIMWYWLTNTGASSARIYAEHPGLSFAAVKVDIPAAVSVFPGEIYTPPKAWAEQAMSRLIYWNRAAKGGHFAAFEQPELFTAELRAGFAAVR